jgi:hypothetical protein
MSPADPHGDGMPRRGTPKLPASSHGTNRTSHAERKVAGAKGDGRRARRHRKTTRAITTSTALPAVGHPGSHARRARRRPHRRGRQHHLLRRDRHHHPGAVPRHDAAARHLWALLRFHASGWRLFFASPVSFQPRVDRSLACWSGWVCGSCLACALQGVVEVAFADTAASPLSPKPGAPLDSAQRR